MTPTGPGRALRVPPLPPGKLRASSYKKEIYMRFILLIFWLFAAYFLFTCNNPASNNSCSPSINTCTGNPCGYFHIYNSDSIFVAEGYIINGYAYWNGKDCNGNFVPCGAYTTKIVYIAGGMSETRINRMLVADSATTVVTGRKSCDSLSSQCPNSYEETIIEEFDLYGQITSTIGCICCK